MIENKREFNWRLFWNTRQEFVLAILLFFLSFMILIVGVFSQITPINESLAELESTKKELAKFESKANQLTEIASNPEFQKSSEIDKVLPSRKPLLEILTNLNNVATTTEVIIKNFSLNPGEIATDTTKIRKTSSNQKYDYLDLDFSVSGPLWKVQNFMTLIEQTTPISTITNISLNRDIDEDKNAEAQATLILRTFYFTQPIKTTITSPLPDIDNSDREILENISELRPNSLEEQNEFVPGDRGNLFGIENFSAEELVEELEEQSQTENQTEEGGETETEETNQEETRTEDSTPQTIGNPEGGSLFDSLGIDDYVIAE